jgi:hypothetical protein
MFKNVLVVIIGENDLVVLEYSWCYQVFLLSLERENTLVILENILERILLLSLSILVVIILERIMLSSSILVVIRERIFLLSLENV